MKRIKIMLAAIAVLGTVGGALAFKAAHRAIGGTHYCSITKSTCPTALVYATTGIIPLTSYCTLVPGTNCNVTFTKVVADL